MRILVFNSGSSSLKFQLFAIREGPVLRGALTGLGEAATARWTYRGREARETVSARDHAQAAAWVLALLADRARLGETLLEGVAATGHRVVHGGEAFAAPARVTDEVLAQLEALEALAPLHNPPALAVIRACRARLGGVPAVAVFDTAFFHDLPEPARDYALPPEWTRSYGIRRYGFHGIAHRYLYERYLEIAGARREQSRVITLQLGHGCSIAAIRDGRPVETSMGFTPLEGLVMATRPGDLDPGILLHLAARGLSYEEMHEGLNRRAGLLGLSGTSADMEALLALEARGHAGARRAVEAFCHRARKYLGAYSAVLGGAEAVVFGGGIGEHAPSVRARVGEGLAWCGLTLDAAANRAAIGREACVSAPGSAPAVYVIPVDEELLIARETRACLGD